jgi:3-methyl-2-oxobutanoate hydroxymethyltransferase
MSIKQKKTTILTLRGQKRKKIKTVLVTAYDVWQATLADQAGVDIILVGDSLGMTTLGHETTIPVTMDDMIRHTEAVRRGTNRAFLVGDMPYLSYQVSDEEAIRNAGRFVQAGVDCVKVEGAMHNRIKALCEAGFVVMSHLGLTPQTKAKLGGYRVQGKTAKDYEIIRDQALRLQDVGCSFLLLEAMPRVPAKLIAEQLKIPVYGIGAGNEVDGQLVILHDLIGLFFEFKSKFVKRYCDAGLIIQDALHSYASDVREGNFPTPENFYDIKEEELEKMLGDVRWKYEKIDISLRQHISAIDI